MFFVQAPVVADLQAADQRGQRQALQHQRHGDHDEGEEDQQVAVRKRRAVGKRTGSASAAASDTMPRMPHQLMMKNSASGGAARSPRSAAAQRAADTAPG